MALADVPPLAVPREFDRAPQRFEAAVNSYLGQLMQRWHYGRNVSIREIIEADMIERGLLSQPGEDYES